MIGVLSDHVIVAWPLDVILWVVLGFWVARFSGNRGMRPLGPALAIIVTFALVGLVLSQLVELTV